MDETEAVRQAAIKILNTERYENEIYSWNYGIELKDLIKYVIKEFGIDCNLNWIDVSNITDMAFLFKIDLMVIYLNGMFPMSLI